MSGYFTNPISEWVWRSRYKAPADRTIEDTWQRVAASLAADEPDPAASEGRFRAALTNFRFVPGGRVLAGAGVPGAGMLLNCFVAAPATTAEVEHMPETVLHTLELGGGVGCDLSQLPSGAVLPLLECWDAAAAAMSAANPRRGAMIATLRWDHPDIRRFIHAKDEPDRLPHFNLSVLLPDATSPEIETLLQEIAASAWSHGEPGVLFDKRINAENNLWYRERLSATNPCGEVPLPADGACVLGSINLMALLDTGSSGLAFDFDALEELTATAVRMLDRVLDITRFPTPAQASYATQTRRLGLGVMGLGDVLALLGARYGDADAVAFTSEVMRRLCHTAYRSSIALAREKVPFAALDRRPYLNSGFARRLPEGLRRAINADGIRNSHLIALAPTGTISLLANNVSAGVEPIFALEARRRISAAGKAPQPVTLTDCAYARWRSDPEGIAAPCFVTAGELEAGAHIAIQAAAQRFVDNAIAKTVNLPAPASIEDVVACLRAADAAGLKGCTVFRAGGLRCPVIEPADPGALPMGT